VSYRLVFAPTHSIIVRQLRRFAFSFALLPALLFSRTTWAQTVDTVPADQKVKKVFNSAKDRLEPCTRLRFLGEGRRRSQHPGGPEQNKKQFQLHFNDKVICDFAAPGSQMAARLPSSPARLPRRKRRREVQTLTPEWTRAGQGQVRSR